MALCASSAPVICGAALEAGHQPINKLDAMLSNFRKSRHQLFSPLAWRVRLVFWISALMVGAIGVGFAFSADKASELFMRIRDISPWLPLAITPLGMGLLVWFTERYYPGSSGSGIPQAIASLQVKAVHPLRKTLLSIPIAIAKVVVSLLGLVFGASIGREGPTIHVGACIMYSMARLARFPAHYLEKGLILGGSAAGLSAAFNTPLAGIVFAIEELNRTYEEYTSGIVLTSVIFAGLTTLIMAGNYSYFGEVSTALPMDTSWVVIPICGVIGGLFGGLFSQLLIKGSQRLGPIRRSKPILFGMGCGLLIVVVGLLAHGHTYGTGYGEARALLGNGQGDLADYHGTIFSPFLKIAATLVSYLSGIPGGLFSPSLSAGAELGGAMAHLAPFAPRATVILLGMAAYFAGVVQTPITTFVIVMEMTDNNGLIVPLMATTLIAHGTSRLICPEPVYAALARAFWRDTTAPAEEAPATGDGDGKTESAEGKTA